MSATNRLLWALCLTQSPCLAVGLWIRGQFLESLSAQSAAAGAPHLPGLDVTLEVVSFLWICGLQCAVAWLLVQRLMGDEVRKAIDAREESLLAAKELVRTRDAVIFGLAKLAESRDADTGQHLERISLYSMKLASALRKHPKFCDLVTPSFVKTIGISSVLHDIGKVGIEDSILLKPGLLNDDERFRIQVHTKLGGDCIREIERRLGDSEFLRMAREIAFHHHEWWDGTGYPDGLRGEAIPLAARIVAIADVYDALSVVRIYKPAYPHDYCVQEIREGAGKQFDPDLVAVFLTIANEFKEIALRFSDLAVRSRSALSERDRFLSSLFDGDFGHAATRFTPAGANQLAAAN